MYQDFLSLDDLPASGSPRLDSADLKTQGPLLPWNALTDCHGDGVDSKIGCSRNEHLLAGHHQATDNGGDRRSLERT